jgi:predicted MFS family arabinose efflux permease
VNRLAIGDAGVDVVRRTQTVDVARSVPLGLILPLETSVLLTIAIKQFDAAGPVKGLIAAAGGIGLLASPAVTALTRRRGRTAMAMASTVSLVSLAGFLIAASGSLAMFVIGSVIALAAFNSTLPLLTFTYERNFPAHERGRRVGRGMVVKVAVSAPLAIAMGAWLRDEPGRWWIVVLIGAVATAALSWLYRHIPSERLDALDAQVLAEAADHAGDDAGRLRLLPHFDLLRTDRQLGLTLTAWMMMGFGNLMLLPLRVEYLAQPRYGIEANAAKITLLTVAIPSVVRLVMTTPFGRLFDQMSFFAARIMINLLFAAYIVAFFTGTSTAALWTGAIMLGVATAGGDLMWMLWVTKFAPAGKVADYMGLHTFFTGIRAVAAPLVAFTIVGRLSLGWIAVLSAALILLSAAILLPEARADRRVRAATA